MYYLLRIVASNCSGSGCDWFIPVSVLIPLLILVLVAVTGLRAFSTASKRPTDRTWAIGLGALTVLGVLGPVLALAIFRDSPDRFVPVATALTALVPIAALLYTTAARHA